MLKFMIPNKFDFEELDWISYINSKYSNKIVEIFGSVASDKLGSVRERYRLPDMSDSDLRKYVSEAKSRGITVSYTINLSCFGSFDDLYNKIKIMDYLNWLLDMGIEQVIVANPAIAEIITNNTNLNIEISTVAFVNSLDKLKFWVENFRVNKLCPDFSINRDFGLLKEMSKIIEVQLMVNEPCLYNCPMRQFHNNLQSHVISKNDIIDRWPLRVCTAIKAANEVEWLKCPFIRPQDLRFYQERCDISSFKIVGRTFPLSFVKTSVEPYLKEYYDGNLLDLIPLLQNIQKDVQEIPLYIDCKKLDGFIEGFSDKNCFKGCINCQYCNGWAKKVILKNDKLKF